MNETKKVLRLLPVKGMISEIGLVNITFFKYGIQPFRVALIIREFVRDGVVYQPREGFYKKA